jgi:hypothetical protein
LITLINIDDLVMRLAFDVDGIVMHLAISFAIVAVILIANTFLVVTAHASATRATVIFTNAFSKVVDIVSRARVATGKKKGNSAQANPQKPARLAGDQNGFHLAFSKSG